MGDASQRWAVQQLLNARYARGSGDERATESDEGGRGGAAAVRRNSNRRAGAPSGNPQGDAGPEPVPDAAPGHSRDKAQYKSSNERLYEAYSDLHTLAQQFEKPFDAPAILVVGHQTDGKSALVEALMGFQFNHVGGGTKTRRPITLHMKYNSSCVQPSCYVLTETAGEQEVTLEELQEYIEAENQRLQSDEQFWAKEIVVKIEYKYCPNLTIIDTPGLISPAPGKKNAALQMAAKQVEAIVRQKMAQREYIILCLEDTSDWNNATTRKVVMQVDPTLSRTVVVSTKLDTRIPQFATPADVETFLRAPGLQSDTQMLGGSPFFTSVPSGRVGAAKDAVFRSNEHFREAVAERQAQDVQELEAKLGRRLDRAEASRIGVHQLRSFLEQVLQRRYLEYVPSIVPLLEREYRNAAARLEATQEELSDLQADKLKEKGRLFRESFLTKLSLLLRGTVAAPAERFGETLADEHLRGGAFVALDGATLPVPDGLPNVNMRLFGGAQFHRAMAEFRLSVGQLVCPDISREEIVNACGMEDTHDGVNYVRTACVIAVSKARDMFEPFLHQLGYRLAHVVRRLLPVAMYLLQRDGSCLSGHDLFLKRVGSCYHAFIDEVERNCKARCLEDLSSTTRYVSWSLHTRNNKALKAMLAKAAPAMPAPPPRGASAHSTGAVNPADLSSVLVDILDCTLWQRQLGVISEEIVAALVCQVFEGIRDNIVQAAELKFNCFFLMPLVDSFPARLRSELECAYEDDVEEVFDVAAVRGALETRLRSLEAEQHQVERLQRKFAGIHSTLAQQHAMGGVSMKASEFAERMSLMSLADSASLSALGARLKSRRRDGDQGLSESPSPASSQQLDAGGAGAGAAAKAVAAAAAAAAAGHHGPKSHAVGAAGGGASSSAGTGRRA